MANIPKLNFPKLYIKFIFVKFYLNEINNILLNLNIKKFILNIYYLKKILIFLNI